MEHISPAEHETQVGLDERLQEGPCRQSIVSPRAGDVVEAEGDHRVPVEGLGEAVGELEIGHATIEREHLPREGRVRPRPLHSAHLDQAVLAHGPVLFAGDSAAATDALTGEGIGQALLTGILAGEAVLAGGPPAEIGRRYEKSVRHHLLADHRMSVALQHILSRTLGARATLRMASVSSWSRRNFALWMFEDYQRALVLTPHRWRQGLLGRRGTYLRRLEG